MDVVRRLSDSITQQNLWSGEITLRRNEFLIKAGSIEKNLYFIKSGTLIAFLAHADEEFIIRFGYKDSIINALDSFFTGSPTRYNLKAIKQCKLRFVSKKNFNILIRSSQELKGLYQIILEQLVVQQMDREIDLLVSSPAERYRRVLRRSPDLFQEVPHKYIASYLRMTPETLSRLKKS